MTLEPSLKTWLANVSRKALPAPFEKGSRFLVVLVSARVLGPTTFGAYQLATGVAALVAAATELGLGTWATRSIAREGAAPAGVARGGLRVRALSGAPFLLLLAIAAYITPSRDERLGIVVLGLAALASSFVDYAGAVLRGYEAFGAEARVNITRALLSAGGGLAGLFVTRSLSGLAVGLLAGATVSAVMGSVVAAQVRDKGPASPPVLPTLRELAPIGVAGLLSTFYFRIDTVLLRAFLGDDAVGLYGAAYRVFEGTMLFPATLNAVSFPRLARSGQVRGAFTALEMRLVLVHAVAGILVGAVVYVLAPQIATLAFGAPFAETAPLLEALAKVIPVLFVNYALTSFTFARGHERQYLVVVALLSVTNIAANVVLLPRFGAVGAAWATLLTELCMTAGCGITLLRGARGSSQA